MTFKGNVKLGKNQVLGFKPGSGYYAKTVPPPPPSSLLPPKHPSYTAAQEATLHAKQLLAPQYKQADVEAARQNEAIRRFTADAMQQLAGLAPQIGHDYTSALDAQSGLVNSAADALRNSNPQGNVSALLNSIGAPASQQQSATQGLSDAFNGAAAVGQYSDSLPIGALRSQGLAAETLARLQPGFTALGGRQAQITALQNQSDARGKIGEQLPALEQSWLSSLQSNKAKQQQLALEANALGLKTQNQNFNQNLQTAKLKNQQNEFIATYKQKAAAAGLKAQAPNAALSKSVGYLVNSAGVPITDPQGRRQILPGFNTNAQGRVVKTKNPLTTNSSKPFGNLTKTQVQQMRAGMANAFYGFTDPKTNTVHPPLSYQGAIKEAVTHGYSRAAATRMANSFYMPGKGGRPGTGYIGLAKPFSTLTQPQLATLHITAHELRFGTVFDPKRTNPQTIVVNGKTYEAGDTIPPFSYPQAIRFLVSRGYSRGDSVAMLNNFYAPAQRR